MAFGKTVHGVGKDGKPRARVPVTPGMVANPNRDHEASQPHRKGNIALDGSPKRHQNVGLAGSMTENQRALTGMAHAVSVNEIPDASSGNPLDPMPKGKSFPLPKPANKGVGELDHDLAARIIGEAVVSGSSKI
jgi:hypothetical protein